jgi:hypothetical protein
MAKSFNPSLKSLERRQMLSITLSTPHSTLQFNSIPEVHEQMGKMTATADNAVGAGYSVGVFQNTYAQIASVDYTFPNSLAGDGLTGYGISKGFYQYRTSVHQVVKPTGPSALPAFHEFWDNHQTTNAVKVDVHYASATHLPDDVYTVTTTVFAPQAQIQPQFPPKSGAGAYGLVWTDHNNNALKPGYSQGNNFGLGAEGPSPFLFHGSVRNTTPVIGTFFFTQLATPTNISTHGYQYYSIFKIERPWNDYYSNSVGLDEWRTTSNSSFPLATFGYSKTLRGWDGPVWLNSVWDDPGFKNEMTPDLIPWNMTYYGNFQTMICFQASGNSIPIVISSVNWSIAASYNNDSSRISPNTRNAFGDPSRWVGSSTVKLGNVSSSNPQLIPGYTYNVVDFMASGASPYKPEGALPAGAGLCDLSPGPVLPRAPLDHHRDGHLRNLPPRTEATLQSAVRAPRHGPKVIYG